MNIKELQTDGGEGTIKRAGEGSGKSEAKEKWRKQNKNYIYLFATIARTLKERKKKKNMKKWHVMAINHTFCFLLFSLWAMRVEVCVFEFVAVICWRMPRITLYFSNAQNAHSHIFWEYSFFANKSYFLCSLPFTPISIFPASLRTIVSIFVGLSQGNRAYDWRRSLDLTHICISWIMWSRDAALNDSVYRTLWFIVRRHNGASGTHKITAALGSNVSSWTNIRNHTSIYTHFLYRRVPAVYKTKT